MMWWGMSKTHGWVVLDRDIPNNMPGKKIDLIFLRCSDWTFYEEKWRKWDLPEYDFIDNYIGSLPRNERNKTLDELKNLRSKYYQLKIKFKDKFNNIACRNQSLTTDNYKITLDKHHTLLKRYGLESNGIRKQNNPERLRQSGCWNCKFPVDNIEDYECCICGWIICDKCGACGCAYKLKPEKI